MEIYNSNNNNNVRLTMRKRFSPSKLVPDFSRRYPKIEPLNDKKPEEFTSLFKHSNKYLVHNNPMTTHISDLSIPKKHSSNWRSNLSNSSGDSDSIDNNRILAIIAKEKFESYSNLSEFELEDSFNRNLISTRYLSTPFDDDFNNSKKETSSFNSGSQMSYATNRDVYLEQKLRTDMIKNKQQFKKYKVNDYFFQNLVDFENKFFKKNERLRLSETPVSSRFYGVEKYGFIDERKKQLSPVVTESIQKNKELLTKINKSKRHIDGFYKLKPIEKPRTFPEERDIATPPLLNFYNFERPRINNRDFVRLKCKRFN